MNDCSIKVAVLNLLTITYFISFPFLKCIQLKIELVVVFVTFNYGTSFVTDFGVSTA